ncbi:MAG TPA: CHAP domain-containing protein [Streptosporangiaceae bacterium]
MPATAERVLDVARSQLGYTEPGWGDKPGTQVTKYGQWYAAWSGRPAYRDTYWCAEFASWVLATAGFAPDEAGRYGNCTPWTAWFKKRNRWGATPRPGAVVFYDWDGDGHPEHVGIVESIRPDGRIVTIEGNATTPGGRDGVKCMIRQAGILGYGYPPYTSADPTTPGPGSGGVRPGYPTLFRGTGGPEDASGGQRWWVSQWYQLMSRHSPGYFAEISGDPDGTAEIERLEIGDVTLRVVREMATQVLGRRLHWTGAITAQIWSIYPPVT